MTALYIPSAVVVVLHAYTDDIVAPTRQTVELLQALKKHASMTGITIHLKWSHDAAGQETRVVINQKTHESRL